HPEQERVCISGAHQLKSTVAKHTPQFGERVTMTSADRQVVRTAHPLVRGLANEKNSARLEHSIHLTDGFPSRFLIQLIDHVKAGNQIKLAIAKWESVGRREARSIDLAPVPKFGCLRRAIYSECLALE